MPHAPSLLPPGSTIGILGGGQLGRMTVMAAARMGYHTHIYSPKGDNPAFEVAAAHTEAEYLDAQALEKFARSVDVITIEFENIPVGCVRTLAQWKPIHPSPEILEVCQHRVREKECAQKLGIGTAPFVPVHSLMELQQAVQEIGMPCILKTSRLGYDGKGQVVIRAPQEAKVAWEQLKADELILEGFIDFAIELSMIVARNTKGEIACFPTVQNIHKNHILHQTIAPAPIRESVDKEAETIARKLAEELNLIGLLAVEMFLTKDDRLLVNELAPRPHNSGHWTLDACATSQFEQLLRAICGLPLGSTKILCPAMMTNLIGDEVNSWQQYLAEPNARLHLYGKKEARPGRKMGHVTKLLDKMN